MAEQVDAQPAKIKPAEIKIWLRIEMGNEENEIK